MEQQIQTVFHALTNIFLNQVHATHAQIPNVLTVLLQLLALSVLKVMELKMEIVFLVKIIVLNVQPQLIV